MNYIVQEDKKIDPVILQSLFQCAPWAKNRTPSEIEQMLQHSDLVFSIWDGNQVVGFTRVLTDFTFRAMIYDVVIHSEYQGEGLGRLLLEKVIHHPRLSQIACLSLFTRDRTDFYERLGFKTDTQHGLNGMLYVRPIPSTYC